MANVDLKTNFKNGDKLYDYELNNNFKAIQAALGAMNKIVWQNDDNASLVMFAGTTEQITNRELIEGQLLYNTQTGETYIDAMVDTELKRISTGGGTSIQIGGIEPTNPATKLWVEDDMLDNIGSEIESGSNENGSYIKFADGTMICFGITSVISFTNTGVKEFIIDINSFWLVNITTLDATDLSRIGTTAFNSSALDKLILRKNVVCVLDNINCFENTPIADGTGFIYVPDALYDAYLIATNWSVYASQIKKISELNE